MIQADNKTMNADPVGVDPDREAFVDVFASRPIRPVGVILLAAGLGSRYLASLTSGGRNHAGDVHKLLAMLPDGRHVGQASAQAACSCFETVMAVVRPDQMPLAVMFEACGCRVLVAPDALRGMGASLAAGARWFDAQRDETGLHRYRGCLVTLADMPWVARSTLDAVAAHVVDDAVVAPYFQDRRGHPMGFGARRLAVLGQLDGDRGARDVLRDWPQCRVDVDDSGVVLDVDTIDDIR